MTKVFKRKMRMAWIAICLLLCFTQAAFAESFDMDFTPEGYLNQYDGDLPYSSYNFKTKPTRGSVERDVMVDPDYSFRVVLDYDGDGVNDLASRTQYLVGQTEPYTWLGKDYTVFNLKKNSTTKPKIRYSKLLLYKKQWIDVETTVVSWGTDDDSKAYFCGGFVETNLFNVRWIRLEHKFYLAGTNTPVEVSGFLTYEDIDLWQGIALRRSEVDKLWCNTGTDAGGYGTRLEYLETDTLLKIKDTDGSASPSVPETEEDRIAASRAVFAYTFSGSSHTQYFMDASPSKARRALFAFSSAKVIPSALPGEEMVTKTITDSDEQEVTENTIAKASEIWTYHVNAPVPLETERANFIDGLAMSDEIDGCLEVKSVKVFRGEDEDVTQLFDITKQPSSDSGGPTKIKADAKNTASVDFYGYTYSMRMTVCVKAGENRLKDHGHFDREDASYKFRNTGKVTYKVDSEDHQWQTNETATVLHVPWSADRTPGLKISKATSKRVWFVGNMIDYTITVQNKNPDAIAENVLIEDYDIPEILRIDGSTLKLTGCQGEVTKEGNGFKAQVPELAYGQTATITFKAKATENSAEWNIRNTATAKADLVPEVSDTADVVIYSNESVVNITKAIRSEDLYSYHGAPVFVFRLAGTTTDGESKEYYSIMEFPSSENDPQESRWWGLHKDNGTYKKTVSFYGIKPGTYVCEEISADRFELEEIKDLSDNAILRDDSVRFRLRDAEEGHATFVNRKGHWDGYSDSQCVVNQFGSDVM